VETNALYYGDNLGILREYIPNESVDLVYLDPPFNSNRDYNVIFKDESGRKSDAQILAFEDTWHWGPDAESQYSYLTNTALNNGKVPAPVSSIVAALRHGIGENQMLAYIVEMAVRLVELRRVLRPTGSLWLHCDPTASHYLRLVLDAIFGPENFQNEIIWKRTTAHSDSKRAGRIHDVLLFYARSEDHVWNKVHQEYDEEYVAKYYHYKEPSGRQYASGDVAAAGPGPARMFNGVLRDPPPGSHWRFTQEKLDHYIAEGRIFFTANGFPRYKRYLDEMEGTPLQDLWADKAVQPVVSWSKEGLGYPTQKPVGLLERIVKASSNPGDLVLDPFCGCGTALVASQKLGRKWVGIDVTYLSIAVMKARLRDSFGIETQVIGQPTEVDGAKAMLDGSLASQYQFQWWALDLVGAQPQGGTKKKGADKGVDGIINFTGPGRTMESAIVSVKSGGVGAAMIQQLKGAMETHGAAMGLFITLEEPTAPMKQEATVAGLYHSEVSGKDYPKVQILTIRELLEEHRKADLPLLVLPAFQQAEKVELESPGQEKLFGSATRWKRRVAGGLVNSIEERPYTLTA
jgi:site-specific DNA-methyltransferase (adenine-specific)